MIHTMPSINRFTLRVIFIGLVVAAGSLFLLPVAHVPTAYGSGSITSVTVSCNPNLVADYGYAQCAATVAGTGIYSNAVTWSASAGTISSAGWFTASSTPGAVTITATSVQDTTKKGTATVTVGVTCTDGASFCGFITIYNPGNYGTSQCYLYGSGGQGGQECDGTGKLTYINPKSNNSWYVTNYHQGYVPSSDVSNDPYYNHGFFNGMSAWTSYFNPDDGGNYYISGGLNGSNESCTCFYNWGAPAGTNCADHDAVSSKSGTVDPGQPVNVNVINACAPHSTYAQWGGGSVSVYLRNVTYCESSLTIGGVNYVPTAPGVCSPQSSPAGAITVFGGFGGHEHARSRVVVLPATSHLRRPVRDCLVQRDIPAL